MNEKQVNIYKDAMANYPTGVTIMTTTDSNGDPIGLTVNSFASVSIDPILVLWSINKEVSTYPPFSSTEKFAVNVLAGDQANIANAFAMEDEDKRFSFCDWEMSENGLPIIKNSVATMECTVHHKIEVGTHVTYFGEVFNISATHEAPLLYHNRKMDPLPGSFHK